VSILPSFYEHFFYKKSVLCSFSEITVSFVIFSNEDWKRHSLLNVGEIDYLQQSVVATRQKRGLGIARNRFMEESIVKEIQRKRSDVRFHTVQVRIG